MKVVELLPGGGWYTMLLAPVLAENGEFFVAYGTSRVSENVLGEDGFDKVQSAAGEAKIYRPEGSRFYVLENPDLGVSDVDIIFTFRNYHNFGAEGRAAMNQAVYDALVRLAQDFSVRYPLRAPALTRRAGPPARLFGWRVRSKIRPAGHGFSRRK